MVDTIEVQLVHIVDEAGDTMGYIAKGHWEPELFISLINKDEMMDKGIDPKRIQHSYQRWVPYSPNQPEYEYWNKHIEPAKKGVRGAFPCTSFYW